MCYGHVMAVGDVSVRELRNEVSAVLRRVEAGERVRITVDRRPVLVPLTTPPRWASGAAWRRVIETGPADPELLEELDELLPQTTDEL